MQDLSQIAATKLSLTGYRNFPNNYFEFSENNFNIICGKNGSGKTNLLEAISLLFPGRGLRGEKLRECGYLVDATAGSHMPWSLRSTMHTSYGAAEISTSFNGETNTNSGRNIYFNDSKISNKELAGITSVSWLTPLMNYLFVGPSSERRRFFDRLASNFYPEHNTNLNKYEHYQRERAQLLFSDNLKGSWIDSIEVKMAELASAIVHARLTTMEYLQNEIDKLNSNFTKIMLNLEGEAEKLGRNCSALEFESEFAKIQAESRSNDRDNAKTSFGPHRTDFGCINLNNNKHAKLCSTGEQKAILVSLIISEIMAKLRWRKIKPILLFDELTVHFDKFKQASLFEILKQIGCQTFITSIDSAPFDEFISDYKVINLE